MEIVNNTFNYAYDYTLRANAQKQAISNDQGVQPDTRGVEKNESSNQSKSNQEQNTNTTKDITQLSGDERALLSQLKAADRRVKAHEAAHQSGPAASGGATYTYKKGPDGVMYAVGGEVPVRIQTGSTPQESIANLQGVIATALAPADPSPQDISIASKAKVMMMKAQQELAAEIQEKMRDSNAYAQNAKSEYERNSSADSNEKNSKIIA